MGSSRSKAATTAAVASILLATALTVWWGARTPAPAPAEAHPAAQAAGRENPQTPLPPPLPAVERLADAEPPAPRAASGASPLAALSLADPPGEDVALPEGELVEVAEAASPASQPDPPSRKHAAPALPSFPQKWPSQPHEKIAGELFAMFSEDPRDARPVRFYLEDGVDEAAARRAIEEAGIDPSMAEFDFSWVEPVVRTDATWEQILAAADRPEVFQAWGAEPPAVAQSEYSAWAANVLPLRPGGSTGFNLSGNGVALAMWEASETISGVPYLRVRDSHQELAGRVWQAPYLNSYGMHWHSTGMAGVMISAGSHPYARGMAPEATVRVYNCVYWRTEWASQKPLYVAGNNSWSYVSSTGVYGLYTPDDRDVDINLQYDDMIQVAVSGNQVNGLPNGELTPFLVRSPGNSKDIITVGALGGKDLFFKNWSDGSNITSAGPTQDFRVKPDLMAPGYDVAMPTSTGNADYRVRSGSSVAAATVTGIVGLLTQHMRTLRNEPTYKPPLSLIKAVLIHTAVDYFSLGPDYRSGWGLVDAAAAAKFLKDQKDRTATMQCATYTGTPVIYSAGLGASQYRLRFTLVWSDPPGTPAVDPTAPTLVNDLNLVVTDPAGKSWFPWRIDVNNPTGSALNDGSGNHRDNVEVVDIYYAPAGSYTVTITGPPNKTQQYALLWDGPAHSVPMPLQPKGPTAIAPNVDGAYLSGIGGYGTVGACSWGHPLTYSWGCSPAGTATSDGTPSGTIRWSGSNDSSGAWVFAKCSANTGITASNLMMIRVSSAHVVGAAVRPLGPARLLTGEAGTYSTFASCSQGHTVEYLFDWDDGTNSGWGGSSATKAWASGRNYSYVSAKARCTALVEGPAATVFTLCSVSVVPAVGLPYSEAFDGSTPGQGWTFQAVHPGVGWAADATPSAVGGVTSYSSPPRSLNYNNGTDYAASLPNDYSGAVGVPNMGTAVSPFIRLTGARTAKAMIYFSCLYQTQDATSLDRRTLEIVSAFDNRIVKEWPFVPGPQGCDAIGVGVWHGHYLELDPSWKGVQLRFRFDTATASYNNYAGWFVDYVWVYWNDTETPTQPTIAIENGAATTKSLIVTLTGLGAVDDVAVTQMQSSNDGASWSAWEPYATARPNWDLSTYGGNTLYGPKTVWARYRDATGKVSANASATISYLRSPPYQETFDGASASADWTFWSIDANVRWSIDSTPSSMPGGPAHSSPNSLNYNNGATYNRGLQTDHWTYGAATSPVVDISGTSLPRLSFWCNYVTETSGTEDDWRYVNVLAGGTQVGGTGVLFTVNYTGAGPCAAMGAWHQHTLDLDPAWSTIQVQFGFISFDKYLNDFPGWFVDDVAITSDGGAAGASAKSAIGSAPGGTPQGDAAQEESPRPLTHPHLWSSTGYPAEGPLPGPADAGEPPSGGREEVVTEFRFDDESAMAGWDVQASDDLVRWAADAEPEDAMGGPARSAPNSLNYNGHADYRSGESPNWGGASSPVLVLEGLAEPRLRFWCNYETRDPGRSVDQRWVRIVDPDGEPRAITQLATDAEGGEVSPCGESGTWHAHELALDATWGHVRVEFWFDTIDTVDVALFGWFVDDVQLLQTQAAPSSLGEPGTVESERTGAAAPTRDASKGCLAGTEWDAAGSPTLATLLLWVVGLVLLGRRCDSGR